MLTMLALALLVRIRVGLNYSPENLSLMIAIYAIAALPSDVGQLVRDPPEPGIGHVDGDRLLPGEGNRPRNRQVIRTLENAVLRT